ncbi:lysophospholipid acyltransferase family protein [Thioclava sp. L04-15]|uniref:lysophospholipid acyltransferase family protein n=1 Tax=Thioclava sp. L04-15 TaxID=1915318 RepID=UPI001FEE73BF|nr:lysophospholipid acyltransferase family protein [Thioclava sp. L04-15]
MTTARDAGKAGGILRRIAARITGLAIALFARFITSPRVYYAAPPHPDRQTVYFANHRSNADTVLIWTVLGAATRAHTRPVAAADYWLKSPLRKFVGLDVFNVIPIERLRENRTENPVEKMLAALETGASLIIFPEGRRNESEAPLLEMRPGIYHLGQARPELEFVPVWIENLNGVLPRGSIIPVPLLCTLTFGAALRVEPGESRDAFMARARAALLALASEEVRDGS